MRLTAYFAGVAGLLVVYLGLRRTVAPGVAVLATLLLAGGSSLLLTLHAGSTIPALAFALVAALVFGPRWLQRRWVEWAAWPLAILTPVALASLSAADGAGAALFSPRGGFLSLHPVSYVALAGLIGSARRTPVWTTGTLVALTVWVVADTELTPAVALLAPGLASVLEWACRRPLAAVAPLVAFAVLWNYWLMVQYTAGMVPKDAPVSFAAMVRQQADVHTRSPYIYPWAFPANVLFAWREGVPVARYDVLSTEPARDAFELDFVRGIERFLLEGWGPPGISPGGPHPAYRWIDASPAALVFPLTPPDRAALFSAVASAHGEPASASTMLTFSVNDQVIGRAEVSPRAAAYVNLTLANEPGGRVLRAGYNRLSIVTAGPHRVAIHHIRIAPLS